MAGFTEVLPLAVLTDGGVKPVSVLLQLHALVLPLHVSVAEDPWTTGLETLTVGCCTTDNVTVCELGSGPVQAYV